jgi:hypothetical protein
MAATSAGGANPLPAADESNLADARIAARAKKVAERTGRSLVRAEDIHGGNGAGWGFDAEARAEREEEGLNPLEELSFEELFAQAKSSGLNMTARQQRLVEQLERRAEKLANVSTETERIKSKSIEGLSEGQQAALGRNEERAKSLNEEMESLKDQIAEMIREQLGTKRAIEKSNNFNKGSGEQASLTRYSHTPLSHASLPICHTPVSPYVTRHSPHMSHATLPICHTPLSPYVTRHSPHMSHPIRPACDRRSCVLPRAG